MRYTLNNPGGHLVILRLPRVVPVVDLPKVLHPFTVRPEKGNATNSVTIPARSTNRVLTALYALGWRHA